MAEFLTTHGTAFCVVNIITEAKKELILISPYLQLSVIFLGRIKEADVRKVPITIVYGKSELSDKELSSLSALKNLTLLYCHNLHAKCYANESALVITSMNMYEFSEKNNREMGILLEKEKDSALFTKANAEIKSIIGASEKVKTYKATPRFGGGSYNKTQRIPMGYCIRCEEQISLNTNHPLCDDCYNTWAQYGDEYYTENFCHTCGKPADTSHARPNCYSCYKVANSNLFL